MKKALIILKGLISVKVESWQVLILCLIGASTFWVFKALNKNYTTTINYPIAFNYDSEGFIEVAELPNSIAINVTGMGWDIFRKSLNFKNPPVDIALESPSEFRHIPGSFFLPVVASHFKEIDVNFIATDSFSFDIQKRVSRKFLLVVDSSSLNLEPNVLIKSPILIEPDSVTLIGPQSMVNGLSDTIELDLSTLSINQNVDQNIDIVGTGSGLVNRDPVQTRVKIDVLTLFDKELDIVAEPIHVPEEMELYSDLLRFKVRYKVTEAFVNTRDSLSLQVDFSTIKADSILTPKLLYAPDYIKNIVIEPREVDLSVN